MQSITREGFRQLVSELRTGRSGKFTSHDLAAIFKGEKSHPRIRAGTKFHPKLAFPQFYSRDPPDIALTYTWATDLVFEMEQMFDELFSRISLERQKNPRSRYPDRELRFWIDICFNDQNSQNMKAELDVAESIYSRAPFHFVFMAKGPLQRGWCLFEIAVRTESIMAQYRLAPDAMVQLFSSGDQQGNPALHAFSQFIVCPSVSAPSDSSPPSVESWFHGMSTFKPDDKRAIQDRILTICGSPERFDNIVRRFTSAALNAWLRSSARRDDIGTALGAAFTRRLLGQTGPDTAPMPRERALCAGLVEPLTREDQAALAALLRERANGNPNAGRPPPRR